MKIVILANDFRVYWKQRLIYLHQYLNSNNIEFSAIELFGSGSPYSFDTSITNLSWSTCLFPNDGPDTLSKQEIKTQLFESLDLIQPDLIIAAPITFFSGALGLQWAKKREKKFVMFDDAKPHEQFKRNFVVKWIRSSITSQIDGLWLPSVDYKNVYPALKKSDVHFFYGYSCIDNNFFKPKRKRELNNNNIVCVARLVPVKNIENLLKAWQLVEQKGSVYKLSIIGDGPAYGDLNELSKRLNLKNVSFLGSIDNRDMAAYYFKADALILASLSETWGLVVNEAMAAGLPVLLSDQINAGATLLKEGINGFRFDPLIVEELADVILKYINSSIVAKEQMSASSLAIIETMSYENMGSRLSEALPIINSRKFKKPGFVASTLINLWYGKNDTSSWDNKN